MNYSKANVQMLSSCSVMLALCDPVDCTMPGFPVLHRLPEFAQTHVHWVGDATRCNIQITTWYFCFFFFALKKKKKKGRYLSHTHVCVCAQSCLTLFDFLDCRPPDSPVHHPPDFPGKNAGMNYHFLPQGSSWPRNQTRVSCVLLFIPG